MRSTKFICRNVFCSGNFQALRVFACNNFKQGRIEHDNTNHRRDCKLVVKKFDGAIRSLVDAIAGLKVPGGPYSDEVCKAARNVAKSLPKVGTPTRPTYRLTEIAIPGVSISHAWRMESEVSSSNVPG